MAISQNAPRRRGRILVSLLVLLFCVGVVPLLYTSWQLESSSRQMLYDDQKQLQQDKAKSLSLLIAEYLKSAHARVQGIAKNLELDVDSSGGDLTTRLPRITKTKALERYVTDDPINYLAVADRTGSGPFAGPNIIEPAIVNRREEGFNRALQQGKTFISDPVMWKAASEPLIVIAEPIWSGGGAEVEGSQVQGVVVALATLGPLLKTASELSEHNVFEVYVVDRVGRLVIHADPYRLQGALDLSSVEIVKHLLASRGRTSNTERFSLPTATGPRSMLGSFARVQDNSGLGVVVQIDESQAYRAVEQMRRDAANMVAAVTVLAVLFGVLFAGQISRPIRELARGARRLAGGDYSTRVPVKSRNEVGVLADSFNLMGEEIEKAVATIQKAAADNRELFMGSIRMLANAIDEKDPYTRGHSERVAYYSMVIAKHYGMSEEEVDKVYLSGIIHDVGKIGIEDKILRKPAALTDAEYEIMKQHPTKGAHILEAVPTLRDMAGAGLQHHENLDGSGYPNRLKGEEIPLLGRIVSVADAFDAMTTERPYSKAMTFEAALARLRFLAGKKFDPDCVTAMEKAGAEGDLSAAKAHRAAAASRQPSPAGRPGDLTSAVSEGANS